MVVMTLSSDPKSSSLLRRGVLAVLALLLTVGTAEAQSGGEPQTPIAGSVRVGEVTPETLALSFEDAIDRGLRWNLGVLLSRETIRASDGQCRHAISWRSAGHVWRSRCTSARCPATARTNRFAPERVRAEVVPKLTGSVRSWISGWVDV
jgi:hypothetical protein